MSQTLTAQGLMTCVDTYAQRGEGTRKTKPNPVPRPKNTPVRGEVSLPRPINNEF